MAKNLVTLNLDNTDYSFRPYATCSTAATTAAKAVSITGFELCSGATILVRFTNSNIIANPTLNVNSTGAKPITCLGHRFDSNIYYEFVYNGSSWVQIGEEKYRCSLSSGNKNNFPWHRIAYSDVMTTAYNRRTIALILNQAVFGGKYGELVIKVATNATNNASSYEAYWVVNKGFGADDIKIGVNNTFGNTYFDVFYKCPSTWSNLLIEQKTGGYDSNFTKSFTLCSSQEVSDTTTTDRLTSIECYSTIEAAATELHNAAYTAIVSPNISSGTLGKISFNGDLTGNATTSTTATNLASAPSLSVDGNNIKVTAGGKTSSAFTVPYSSNSDKLDNHDSSYFATKTEHDDLASQLQALSAGLKLTASVSPNTIYKNTDTSVTISGSVKDNAGAVTATEIVIKKPDGSAIKTANNVASTSSTISVNAGTAASITYTVTAVASGLPLSATAILYARYPVYYGMGTSAAAVKSNGTKASARTSAVNSTYSATASANGVRFYLLVPSDVTRPTSFTMGGAPVDMVIPSSTTTLDGVAYYVFYTNAVYNNGGKVEIKAN